MDKRSFWLTLCFANLCIVALLGFTLRSKILFSLPGLDFRHFESAHSHFAFAGWVGLTLMTLAIFDILPQERAQKKLYQWILAGIEVSALGMVFTFPFFGYNAISIFFSTSYIAVACVFAVVFIKDLLKTSVDSNVKLLIVSAIGSLTLSFLGALGLVFIVARVSTSSILYRDSVYTFLHFQYNGFFTLSIFALIFNYLYKKGISLGNDGKRFSLFLALSIVPTLFLALLWHNKTLFYVLAAIGCIFILLMLIHFFKMNKTIQSSQLFPPGFSRILFVFAMASFAIKSILQVGTIIPSLANEVYGARPVIIGFLHLVFLGFVTFFIHAVVIKKGYFTKNGKLITYPFYVFATGVIANEGILMLQGLGILFKTNSHTYQWFLWGAAIVLFVGACLIAFARLSVIRYNRNMKGVK